MGVRRACAAGAFMLIVGTLCISPLPQSAAATVRPAKPTVSSFSVTPFSLSPSGGSVTLSATVNNATSCAFSSNEPITGLPVTIPCSNGNVTEVVAVPGNSKRRVIAYRFDLSVTGANTVRTKAIKLLVGGSGVTAISAGLEDTCALLIGGTVDCWGDNQYGQLGNGTTTDSSTPIGVSDLSGVTAISAGYWDICALLTGGTVDCWGDNQYGQLGNGTTTDSPTPMAVSDLGGGDRNLQWRHSHLCPSRRSDRRLLGR